ncbi:MAG: ATP-dependent helicase HrpB [Phycisphaerales bacterium]|nr:ATP-dependent helicase HrpB [Phycisphaerales bacterium]
MIKLPIDAYLREITRKLRDRGSVVVVATPGAGKSTRVPPALMEGGGVDGAIVMLQPRRVAARAVAERIAGERGWEVGNEIGYHVRFEKRYTGRTRIRVMTEGILTRMMLDDPYLDGVGCVILDEFHERNLHTDLAIAFLRELRETVRPELKVVIMSATLEVEPVAAFLGGTEVVKVEGRSWPVEIAWRPGRDSRLEEHIVRVVEKALGEEASSQKPEARSGDVLVFLPGVGEIERVRRRMGEGGRRSDVAVLPLHGSLTNDEQQRALLPDPHGRRKVILATNIAETSLTIDGVRTVVDSGLVRVASFDADRGMDRLDLERVSKASAVQRAGRAGRQAAGKAYRLWSEVEEKHFAEFNVPEVERVDLAQAVLAVHGWGRADVRKFGWFEQPSEERLQAAEELLEMLGALRKGKLTEMGERMVGMPVHPRVGRMLMGAGGKLLGDVVNVAALLADDSRRGWGDVVAASSAPGSAGGLHRNRQIPAPPGKPSAEPGADGRGSHMRLRHLERVREQLMSVARRVEGNAGSDPALRGDGEGKSIEEVLLLGYADRVCRRRSGSGGDPRAGVMVGGGGVRVAEEFFTPALATSELFLALDAHHDPRNKKAEAVVKTWAVVKEEWLEKLLPEQIRTETKLAFDESKKKVAATTRRYFGDLVLAEDPHGKVDADKAGKVLAEALGARARELVLQDERAAKLLARVALVRHFIGEKAWPTFDDAELREVLAEVCAGKKALSEVVGRGEGRRLEDGLRGRLVYPLDRELELLAPESMEVPSGSRIKLEYAMGGEGAPPPPVMAVRLQELFGWTQTPRICGGRIAVLLHLLSPGFKLMQITSDLASFWRNAYFEVRKDLRVRYPKHKWPEDPLAATPEAKGRRKIRNEYRDR